MSKNLERLLTILKAEADVVESINKDATFRYKSNQRLILENRKPFLTIIKPAPFKGEPKQCFQNCMTALFKHSYLSYCEGYVIDSNLPIAILHAWLINDTLGACHLCNEHKCSKGTDDCQGKRKQRG